MIKTPVRYLHSELAVVESYDFSGVDADNFWKKNEIQQVKSLIKKHYISQQNYRCCYCQQLMLSNHGRVWDVEHILPQSLYPQFLFEPRNLAVSCVDCNSAKSDENVLIGTCSNSYPTRSDRFKILHAHYDNYEDHIDRVGFFYIPKSKKGAKTIAVCQLLRYCYEFVGVDGNLADSPELSNRFDAVMDAKDDKESKAKMTEFFRVVKVDELS